MSPRRRDTEWEHFGPKRDLGVTGLSLFQQETGVTPAPARESGEARRDRVIAGMGEEARRKDWIDRIHAALVERLARNGYAGVVSANEARAVYLGFPDADALIDFRFLAALWKKRGWLLHDWEGKSEASGNHARRIARYRFDPRAASRTETKGAA